jgi:hypothetical protein
LSTRQSRIRSPLLGPGCRHCVPAGMPAISRRLRPDRPTPPGCDRKSAHDPGRGRSRGIAQSN